MEAFGNEARNLVEVGEGHRGLRRASWAAFAAIVMELSRWCYEVTMRSVECGAGSVGMCSVPPSLAERAREWGLASLIISYDFWFDKASM